MARSSTTPGEAVRVREYLLHELAATGEMPIASHLPFALPGRVVVDGNAFFGCRPPGG